MILSSGHIFAGLPGAEMFLRERVTLFGADCLDVLATLAENSIDAVVTDPPYALVSISKRFGKPRSLPAKSDGPTGVYARASRGFMSVQWDTGKVAFDPATWTKVLYALKPGGFIAAFGGDRTYHRLACAIEDAGAEIRHTIGWCFGSGFPKNHSLRDIGHPELGTALKPAMELICLARKPLSEATVAANVLRWGTGAINIDGCRVGTSKRVTGSLSTTENSVYGKGLGGYRQDGSEGGHNPNLGRWPANLVHDGSDEVLAAFPNSEVSGSARNGRPAKSNINRIGVTKFDAKKGNGNLHNDSGSAARFFYQVKQDEPCDQNANDAENCSLGCHRPSGGIVPKNALTQEELKIVQSAKSAASLCDSCATAIAQSLAAMRQGQIPGSNQFRDIIGERNAQILNECLALYVAGREDTDIILTIQSLKQLFGSVFHAIATCTEANDCDQKTAPKKFRRFWYTSKADADDRLGSKHPTVKPLDLMQWLVRLITPPGGVVLDPFAGTGTTGEAAWREDMRAVLIEAEPEYQDDIRRRMQLAAAGPAERERKSIKAAGKLMTVDGLPLFAGKAEAAE